MVMQAVAASEALRELISVAGAAAVGEGASLNRGVGESVEQHLAGLLDDEAQRVVSDEVIASLGGEEVPGFGVIQGIAFRWLGGARQPADFLLTCSGAERNAVLPVNLKAGKPSPPGAWSSACAARTLARVALGRSVTDPASVNVDRLAVDLVAGRYRLDPSSSDYFLLTAVLDEQGTAVTVSSQGLLSGVVVEGGRTSLAFRRHSTRIYDVESVGTALVLPDGWDVSFALGLALLPRPPKDELLQAMVVAGQVASSTDSQLKRIAREATSRQ
jgi:hypothetical protein